MIIIDIFLNVQTLKNRLKVSTDICMFAWLIITLFIDPTS